MEEYGGVFRIPCKVNGAKMKLIFDTGAESVCLSMTMAEYLFDNDFISNEDIIGSGSSSVADGRIVDHVVINIKDIEIQGIHLTNVKAVVIDGQNAPLLLGQSAIQKLGPVEINGNILKIKNGENYSDDYIDRLFEEAHKAYEDKLYGRAVEKYAKLYAIDQLSSYGIYKYAWACYMNGDYENAYKLANSFKDYSYFESEKIDIYRLLAMICSRQKKYLDAVNYYELSSKKIQNETEELFYNEYWAADCYYYINYYNEAAKKYANAIRLFAEMHHVDFNYLMRDSENKLRRNEQSYRNDDMDYIFFQLIFCGERTGAINVDSFLISATAQARAGNKYARRTLYDAGIDPYSDAWR